MDSDILLKDGDEIELLSEGGIRVLQNRNLYCFTSDSVLLARFASFKKNDTVADFCAGCGIVGYQYYAIHPSVRSVTFFEMQEELADLCRRTAVLNGKDGFTTECVRLQEIGGKYSEYFSLVLCNPPYETGGFEHEEYKKAVCRKEITITLAEVVSVASSALKFGGRFAVANRADRLAEVLYTMQRSGIEPKRVRFVRGKAGAKPYLLLAEGVKGGKPGTEILPDIVNG